MQAGHEGCLLSVNPLQHCLHALLWRQHLIGLCLLIQ